MIGAHPKKPIFKQDALENLIDTLYECSEACNTCADACLGEKDVNNVVRCIRTCIDCTDICQTTARASSRQTEVDPEILRALVQACRTACESCASECDKHSAHMDHCRICAEVCRRCADTCHSFMI
ncbi:MAG TPA: four-helix bundle copper-binding protein [Verrucomicrobia bacterium]|nr:MAG: hypothetical protein A2X46_03265 [Lentisphaerae bacterium GWF2_57_35]HBA84230.1 four-helix bundle copper-binding protein [Verrucomicrobiota bacterium]